MIGARGSRRTRSLVLASGAIVCAAAAASIVSGYQNDVRAQVGPLVSVVVARGAIPKRTLVTATVAERNLTLRRVPARFVPSHSLRESADAIGFRVLADIAAGDYIAQGELGAPGEPRRSPVAASASGRLVTVSVAGGSTVLEGLAPGTLVDVLVTSDRGPGSPRTYLALQRVELVQVGAGSSSASESDSDHGDSVATLRVSLRGAVLLTAAQNFARELRLIPRGHGDDRLLESTSVSASDLHP